MATTQSAALDRKKLMGDPILVTTIVLLITFLTLFILYPLAILLVDSFVGDGGFSFGVFRRIFAWPFDVLGVARVTAEIAADNERMLRFACGIGMKLEGVKRQAVAGKDKAIFGLLKSERPFMRETHGKSTEGTAAH